MEFDNKSDQNVENQTEVTEEQEVSQEVEQTDEWKDRFLRVSAEFENFKKRTSAEQVQWIQRSQQKVIVDVLAIVDDFERALQQKNEENEGAADLGCHSPPFSGYAVWPICGLYRRLYLAHVQLMYGPHMACVRPIDGFYNLYVSIWEVSYVYWLVGF